MTPAGSSRAPGWAGYHPGFAAPGARAVLEKSRISSFGFPMGQVQAINSSRKSQELKELLGWTGSMSWAGSTQENLWEAFLSCLVPCLGSSDVFGVPRLCPLVEPGSQGRRLPARGWGETPALLPIRLYPEIFSRQPGFSGVLTKMESKREAQGSISPKFNLSVGSEGQRGGSSRVESLGTEAVLSPASLVSHSRHGFDQVFEGEFRVPGVLVAQGRRRESEKLLLVLFASHPETQLDFCIPEMSGFPWFLLCLALLSSSSG